MRRHWLRELTALEFLAVLWMLGWVVLALFMFIMAIVGLCDHAVLRAEGVTEQRAWMASLVASILMAWNVQLVCSHLDKRLDRRLHELRQVRR